MASLGSFLPAGRDSTCTRAELPAQQGDAAAPGLPQHSGLHAIKVLTLPGFPLDCAQQVVGPCCVLLRARFAPCAWEAEIHQVFPAADSA